MNRRPARINPDTLPVLLLLLLVLGASAAASFTVSFAGLSAVAPWFALAIHLAWLIPVAYEVALIGFVVAAFVRMHRGAASWRVWGLVWACTLASSAINALHAWDAGPKGWQGLVGVGIAASFPFITAVTAHTVAGLAFAALPEADTATTPHPLAVLDDVEVQHVTTSALATLTARRAAARAEREARKPKPITDDQRARMRDLRAQGMTIRDIAAVVGVGKTVVSKVLASEPAPRPFELVQEVHTA